MQRPLIICDSCIFRRPQRSYMEILSCDAFPEGVPSDILSGGDHRAPRDDDRGVQYETRPGYENILDAWINRRDSEDDERLGDLGD